jgi:hypothetical protein
MATIFFQHQVNDYDAWRPYYDSDTERREAAGLSEIGVFRKAGDKNLVLVVWGADSLDGFKAMLSSEGLKAKMQEAGVVGEPAVCIGEGM